ncbi:hypothetical protein HYE60_05990, partial [Aggregatibacter actinomycetemcomitans]|uniref:hypothetical protein n=1 Tax=Aggregatibacter actinomycetemcomitans TaxID=714 RepID=UPI00197C53CA
NIYSVLEQLDYHFMGGENAPKKLFAPITSANIIYTYLFEEPKENEPGVWGLYGSYFNKISHDYWDVVSISIGGDDKGMTSVFSEQDFENMNLVFEQK